MARLLVLAAPRSGTRSVASLLRGAGLRVGHEKMLRDGTVSSLFVVDDFLYPGVHMHDRPSRNEFETTMHLVRHPLETISSLAVMNRPHFWHWTQCHTGRSYEADGPLLYAAHFWALWNAKIRAQYPNTVVRLEDFADSWPRIAARFGLNALSDFPHLGKSKHQSLTWGQLAEAEEAVRKEAALYGYD